MMHNHMDRMNSVLSADNVAVVTGAVRGIGRALVHVLEARGMRVIAVDIDQEQLATLGAGEARVLDVAEPAALEALAEELGEVSLLVNNAVTRIGRGFDASLEDWRKAVEINLWGVIHGCRSFLPRMAEPGMIINLGSKQGITNPPGHPVYNLCKAAIKSYTESLSHDLLNRDITAHLLVPGWTSDDTGAQGRGAWTSEQLVSHAIERLAAGEFYIVCPDGEVTADMDRARILWGAGDITENRPPLSRWHPDWKDRAKEALE